MHQPITVGPTPSVCLAGFSINWTWPGDRYQYWGTYLVEKKSFWRNGVESPTIGVTGEHWMVNWLILRDRMQIQWFDKLHYTTQLEKLDSTSISQLGIGIGFTLFHGNKSCVQTKDWVLPDRIFMSFEPTLEEVFNSIVYHPHNLLFCIFNKKNSTNNENIYLCYLMI